MAINSPWIKSALFLLIWLFSPLIEAYPKGSTIIRGRKGEESYDFSGGESEGGLRMSEGTKLIFVVVLSIILFLFIFCFCSILVYCCIKKGPSVPSWYDYICVNNCKKSTTPDKGRIEAHMEDQ